MKNVKKIANQILAAGDRPQVSPTIIEQAIKKEFKKQKIKIIHLSAQVSNKAKPNVFILYIIVDPKIEIGNKLDNIIREATKSYSSMTPHIEFNSPKRDGRTGNTYYVGKLIIF